MIKFAIGGQLYKAQIKESIEKYGGENVSADIFTDMDAAMKVKTGSYDYYVGACQSGAGGALGMAYALLGRNKCFTIAMASKSPKEEQVVKAINDGGKAFGFTSDQADESMSILVRLLLQKQKQ
jgi:hypothetical protein